MKKITYIFLLTLININVYSQVDVLNHTNNSATWYVGWDNSAQSNLYNLNIEHRGTQNINFLTGTPSVNRMTILNGGNVGIGVANPTSRLDVLNDINIQVNAINNAYRLNGVTVLQNWGSRNIFTGAGAGAALTLGAD
ncbi:MAG TPA: hypothetical protein PLO59_01970, partial [Bacteroidia bacterium]|nr:hypothetical protein [Bacteroidia bacterium]